nr:GNAT family N-acetyltransferase [Halomonas sp. 1513]
MIARIMLYIKHRLPWLWRWVEWLNARFYALLHSRRMQRQMRRAFATFTLEGFTFRPMGRDDLPQLAELLARQEASRLRYFQPHGFALPSLRGMWANPAFLMFGVWNVSGELVGYFFLRCFCNRRCFVGRMIDAPSEGQGIGRVMNQIMYHTAWWSGFHCMTTISKHNQAVMRSHQNNSHARTVSELGNDYLLVEFVDVPTGQRTVEL